MFTGSALVAFQEKELDLQILQIFHYTLFYSDILRMDSTNADALYVRGLCLYYEDCIDKAVQFFVQALRMAPDHEKARLACRVRLELFSSSSRSIYLRKSSIFALIQSRFA